MCHPPFATALHTEELSWFVLHRESMLKLEVVEEGVLNAVAFWFDLHLDDCETLTNGAQLKLAFVGARGSWGSCCCWLALVQMVVRRLLLAGWLPVHSRPAVLPCQLLSSLRIAGTAVLACYSQACCVTAPPFTLCSPRRHWRGRSAAVRRGRQRPVRQC